MIKKIRIKPAKLEIFESLDTRMNLLDDDKKYYLNLKKGYEGEVMFDSLTEKLNSDCFILNDLLLKINNSLFQIDTLIIFQKIIQLFEVKNFSGDYLYENERLYTKSKSEIKDPLLQLRQTESSLRQLLQKLGSPFPVEGSVVFVNPEFYLYQAPLQAPLIFPAQLQRSMKKLNAETSKLNKANEILAEKLVSLHIAESPYKMLPQYNYHTLRKGMICIICHSFMIFVIGKKCVCSQCKHEEDVESAVLRNVREYKLLFPDRKVTTNDIFEWCGVIESKKRINRILVSNYKSIGVGQWTFYE